MHFRRSVLGRSLRSRRPETLSDRRATFLGGETDDDCSDIQNTGNHDQTFRLIKKLHPKLKKSHPESALTIDWNENQASKMSKNDNRSHVDGFRSDSVPTRTRLSWLLEGKERPSVFARKDTSFSKRASYVVYRSLSLSIRPKKFSPSSTRDSQIETTTFYTWPTD